MNSLTRDFRHIYYSSCCLRTDEAPPDRLYDVVVMCSFHIAAVPMSRSHLMTCTVPVWLHRLSQEALNHLTPLVSVKFAVNLDDIVSNCILSFHIAAVPTLLLRRLFFSVTCLPPCGRVTRRRINVCERSIVRIEFLEEERLERGRAMKLEKMTTGWTIRHCP